jgi:phosphoribosylamine--glycine ligase
MSPNPLPDRAALEAKAGGGGLTVVALGKDARTSAIAVACAASPLVGRLVGVAELDIPTLHDVCDEVVVVDSLRAVDQVVPTIEKFGADLVVVGPEDPLDAGLVDRLEERGIPGFGPRRALARVETSKEWARELIEKAGIGANPRFRSFSSSDGLHDYLGELGQFVVKPDGLTGGKGVCVFGEHLQTLDEALEYAVECIDSHGRVVIEEKLEGEEFSLQTITDGSTAVHCPAVQDHKRAYEGDTGPNTGGMGSYSDADHSLPFLAPEDLARARAINEQVIGALERETGAPYRGVLYGGFMATADGVRVIEYNARFGDPEAMNVLPLMTADFVEVCIGVVTGTLDQVDVGFRPLATVCKYLVPEGYPKQKGYGDPVPFDRALVEQDDDVRCYWAAARLQDSEILLTDSRTVAFVGIGPTLAEAEQRAERGTASVGGPVRHRRDIGTSELIERRIVHMRDLRGAG